MSRSYATAYHMHGGKLAFWFEHNYKIWNCHWTFEPADEILVLITLLSNDDTDKLAWMCLLALAFAACIHEVWI